MMRRKLSILPAATIAVLASMTSAHALGVSVNDATGNAKLATSVTHQANQEASMKKVEKATKDTADAVGEAGPQGPSGGFNPAADPFYETLQKFAFDPCAINLCKVGTNYSNEQDFERAKTWVQKNYFAAEPLTPDTKRDLDEVRRRAVIYATTGGLAMATIVHNDLADAGGDADALQAEVENSGDMREDIAVNSRVLLAQYKLEVQKLAVLTAMLEVESANAMIQTSSYFELGGTEFPDAFIDSDFADGLTRRIGVTAPSKGTSTPAPNTP